jgi:hypothetical protein
MNGTSASGAIITKSNISDSSSTSFIAINTKHSTSVTNNNANKSNSNQYNTNNLASIDLTNHHNLSTAVVGSGATRNNHTAVSHHQQ